MPTRPPVANATRPQPLRPIWLNDGKRLLAASQASSRPPETDRRNQVTVIGSITCSTCLSLIGRMPQSNAVNSERERP
ncbi:hypothetical protein D3C84_1138950 [compost metagenome]